MKRIVVMNDSKSDVFSTYLLGNKSLEVIRMRFIDNTDLSQERLILTVNYNLKLAEKIKRANPDSKVVTVSGGENKDFESVAAIIYGDNDYDYLNYESWKQFDDILFNEQPRLPKYLIHKREESRRTHSDRDVSVYQPNLYLLNSFTPSMGEMDYSTFLDSSINLSYSYLNWYRDWIIGVKDIFIPLSFRPKKKTTQLEVSFLNEYRGLSILNSGDNVILLGEYGREIILEDYENLPIKVSVIQSSADGVIIKFSKPVNAVQLSEIYKIRLDTFILGNLIVQMSRNVQFLMGERSEPRNISKELSRPMYSLLQNANCSYNRINYPSEIILNNSTKKILRDSSQMIALMDMLSDKPLSWITGPPGTGKTFISAVGVDNFVRRGAHVLIVSHSNLGVDNLVIEVANHVDHNRICRLGNDLEVIDEKVRKFHQGIPKNYCRPDYLGDLKRGNGSFSDFVEGDVTACTLNGLLTLKLFRDGFYKPDVIFCDEASRGSFAEIAPLIVAAQYKVIFIGDNKQLGNIPIPVPILEHFRAAEFMEKSIGLFSDGFFNSIVGNQFMPTSTLLVNRRSLPRIVEIVNIFYGGKLISGRFNPYDDGEVILLDTKEIETEEKKEGTSWVNQYEVNSIAKRYLSQLVKHVKADGKIDDSVIITPYSSQVKALKKKLRNNLLFHDAFCKQVNPKNIDDILERAVITVDAIQGGEREFVWISFVRSNDRQDIGFNKDERRINVAISRGKKKVFIILNSQTFLECGHEPIVSAFSQIILLTKKHHRYFVLN